MHWTTGDISFQRMIGALAGIRSSLFASHSSPTLSSIFSSDALNEPEKATFTQTPSTLWTQGWKVSVVSLAISFYSMNGLTAQTWTGHTGLEIWLKLNIIWWKPQPMTVVCLVRVRVNRFQLRWQRATLLTWNGTKNIGTGEKRPIKNNKWVKILKETVFFFPLRKKGHQLSDHGQFM